MYSIKVDGKHDFEISETGKTLFENGEEIDYDLICLSNTHFHLLYLNKSYDIDVLDLDTDSKKIELKINNRKYTVNVSDNFDTLLKKMGFDSQSVTTVKEVRAPMPGMVLQILVKEGQQIIKGDSLIILEAMKMENIIKSPVDAVVKLIKVKVGYKLEKNQLLITFE